MDPVAKPFTLNRLPLSVRYPFTVIRDQWLRANGKCMVNGKWTMVNEASKGGV